MGEQNLGQTWMCWDADGGSEERATPVPSVFASIAAESFAKERWSDADHAAEQTVCVKGRDGKVHRFVVLAEQAVTFTAREADGMVTDG